MRGDKDQKDYKERRGKLAIGTTVATRHDAAAAATAAAAAATEASADTVSAASNTVVY